MRSKEIRDYSVTHLNLSGLHRRLLHPAAVHCIFMRERAFSIDLSGVYISKIFLHIRSPRLAQKERTKRMPRFTNNNLVRMTTNAQNKYKK